MRIGMIWNAKAHIGIVAEPDADGKARGTKILGVGVPRARAPDMRRQ